MILYFGFLWNYYLISARWLPPLQINKVKVKVICCDTSCRVQSLSFPCDVTHERLHRASDRKARNKEYSITKKVGGSLALRIRQNECLQDL